MDPLEGHETAAHALRNMHPACRQLQEGKGVASLSAMYGKGSELQGCIRKS